MRGKLPAVPSEGNRGDAPRGPFSIAKPLLSKPLLSIERSLRGIFEMSYCSHRPEKQRSRTATTGYAIAALARV
jgi:hypothetical protein